MFNYDDINEIEEFLDDCYSIICHADKIDQLPCEYDIDILYSIVDKYPLYQYANTVLDECIKRAVERGWRKK